MDVEPVYLLFVGSLSFSQNPAEVGVPIKISVKASEIVQRPMDVWFQSAEIQSGER